MVQVLLLLLLFLILGVGPSWAYEEVQVLHEGANSGKGFIEVGKPRAITFTLVTIPDPILWENFHGNRLGSGGWVRESGE